MNFDDELNAKESLRAELRQRDFDDLQNEVAGRETGRAARFLPEGARGHDAAEKRRAEQAETLTRLQLMMRDPAYAVLHQDMTRRLREAQNSLDEMRERAQQLLNEENEAIVRLDARAAKDSSGRAVFKDEYGEARYTDGMMVSEDEAAGIVWRGDEPTLAEREAKAERLAHIEAILADIDAGQVEIGGMQDRLEDEDNPPSIDELNAMGEHADELLAGLGTDLQALSAPSPNDIHREISLAATVIPGMSGP